MLSHLPNPARKADLVSSLKPKVDQVLIFNSDRMLKRNVPIALVICLAGLIMLAIDDRSSFSEAQLAAYILIAVGGLWTLIALYRLGSPSKPLVILSPNGVWMRIPWLKSINIPWSEIEGVKLVSFKANSYRSRMTFDKVPVVLVSKAFYNKNIHEDSLWNRGPNWNHNFRADGNQMQVAFHRELLGFDPLQFRDELEARWLAFKDRTASSSLVAASSPPTLAYTRKPAISRRTSGVILADVSLSDAMKIIASLIGIMFVLGKIAGVWETKKERGIRLEREKWAEQDRIYAEERRKDKEKWDQIWKEFDESFKERP